MNRATYGLESPQFRLPACVGVHDAPGAVYTAATGLPFPGPIHSRDLVTDTWKELVKPLGLDPPLSVPVLPTSGGPRPLQSRAHYIQSRPGFRDTVDWKRPLTFLLWGEVYPCALESWTQLSIGLPNHGARAREPAYIWVIGMALCGDKDVAAKATTWTKNP